MLKGEAIAGFEDVVTGEREPAAEGGAARVAAAATPQDRSLRGVVVAVVSIAGLYFGRDVLIPITLAVMLSFVLSPVVSLLQRARLWRTAAVVLTVLAALAVVGLIGTLIGNQAASLTADAPKYAQTIEGKVNGIQGLAVTKLAAFTQTLGHRSRQGADDAREPGRTAGVPSAMPSGQRAAVPVRVVNAEASPLSIARTILEPVLGPLETLVIVLIVAVFVLVQQEDLRDRFIRVFGSADLHRTTLALDDAGKRLSRYFVSQLAVNASFGIVIGLGLWLIGIPSPAMWGLLAGMLRFVPYIGSALAAVAPMALGAAIEPGWTATIYVALLFFVIEPLTGYVIEPLLYGHSTGLSPVSVIVAAIFWTWVWGPIGLILSTPLTLCLVVTGRHVKSLEFFDVLLGDRPALTAVESFYQRILADDPDEALAQAEALLADHALVDYYDDVVLSGLRLAVEDQARGTLGRERASHMARAMLSVVADLRPDATAADHAAPPGEPPSGLLLSIAGRGAFDDVVAAIVAQLAETSGQASRTLRHGTVSRDGIDRLDVTGVRTIILSYVDLTGSPASLRYLVRRLRARAPAATIVVGLWRAGEAVLRDADLQRALGADAYVGSFAALRSVIADA